MCMGVDSGLSIDSLEEQNIIDDVTEMEKTHGAIESGLRFLAVVFHGPWTKFHDICMQILVLSMDRKFCC
jgi:hypothetical protein